MECSEVKIYVKTAYPDSSVLSPNYNLILDLNESQTIADLKEEITRILRDKLGAECTIATPNELIVLEMRKRLGGEHELSLLVKGCDENNPLLVILPKIKPSQRFIKKPVSSFFEDSTFSDLNQVGIKKSLGYLTKDTLLLGGYNVDELQEEFKRRGIDTYYNGDFLYAYHELSCEQFLAKNEAHLNGWPMDAAHFVKRLPTETVSRQLQPHLYQIISDLFVNQDLVAHFDTRLQLLRG